MGTRPSRRPLKPPRPHGGANCGDQTRAPTRRRARRHALLPPCYRCRSQAPPSTSRRRRCPRSHRRRPPPYRSAGRLPGPGRWPGSGRVMRQMVGDTAQVQPCEPARARVPTTRRSACSRSDIGSRTSTGSPSPTSTRTRAPTRSTGAVQARTRAVASARSCSDRSGANPAPGGPNACATTSSTPARAASRPVQARAAPAATEPSTPTTIRSIERRPAVGDGVIVIVSGPRRKGRTTPLP
jgi:hypothetical protein